MTTTRRDFTRALAASALCAAYPASSASCADQTEVDVDVLAWKPERYDTRIVELAGASIRVRAYENLPYVTRPIAPEYQCLNLYVPDVYFRGGRIRRYCSADAPIFMPNFVGGYMPAKPGTPDTSFGPPGPGNANAPNSIAKALSLGFVVASPGARGRTLRAQDGRWTGKAPAAIVDLKAAARWLRHNSERMPGNVERIVSNGTSAGGALSALLGASANHPDFDAELAALGAAAGRDDVFAVSAYCPITNLEHADAAYEWQFHGLEDYRTVAMSMLDYRVQRKESTGRLTPAQIQQSGELRALFVDYVNGLGLRDSEGRPLRLDANGRGPLLDSIKSLLMASAQRAIGTGIDVSDRHWLKIEAGRVANLDWESYVRAAGRMKALPAFDGFALETGENQLFGNAATDARHFTTFSLQRGAVSGAALAEPRTVRMMNAMHYVRQAGSGAARHWRIRHGTMDRDTSLAVPVLLAAALRSRGLDVDLALPWDRPHGGDYDLDELFAWVEERVGAA